MATAPQLRSGQVFRRLVAGSAMAPTEPQEGALSCLDKTSSSRAISGKVKATVQPCTERLNKKDRENPT